MSLAHGLEIDMLIVVSGLAVYEENITMFLQL